MTLYLRDPDVELHLGDALETLRGLPDESVDCVATSPPFFGLRDYGVDGQIGLEASPDEWASRLVEVFREARRVLRRDGSLWVECGDSYNSGTNARRKPSDVDHGAWEMGSDGGQERINSPDCKPKDLIGQPFLLAFALRADGWYWRGCNIWAKPNAMPESAKDRCTVAHSYVLHFSKSARYFFDGDAISEPAAWERWGDQTVPKHEGTETAAGWMRPRTRDELAQISRPQTRRAWELVEQHGLTEAHLDAIRACGVSDAGKALVTTNGVGRNAADVQRLADEAKAALGGYYREFLMGATRTGQKHPRSVWTVPTQGFPEAHFATWPEALARRIILAACPEWVCEVCGKARERVVEVRHEHLATRSADAQNLRPEVREELARVGNHRGVGGLPTTTTRNVQTLGFTDCGHNAHKPGVVLDPFAGSGTTLYVARKLGRRGIGIDLNEQYLEMAARRLQQQSLFALDNG